MLIYRILNNNAIISKDEHNREIIVLGKGIAFKKSEYDEVDPDVIMKIFELKDKQKRSEMESIVSKIPYEYFHVSEEIKRIAEKELNCQLDEGISLRLADHIYYSVHKLSKGINTPNLMIHEIRRFYPNEYKVGLQAIELVNKEFRSTFDENEAGFITFHLVSSRTKEGPVYFDETIERLHTMINMIEEYFNIELDVNSLDYSRLVTHLKFFIQRMLVTKTQKDQSLQGDSLYEMLISKYNTINQFLNRFNAMILLNYDYQLSDSDRMYLIMHLARVLNQRS